MEHKYRGKRIDNGEWVYGFYAEVEGRCIIIPWFKGSNTKTRPYIAELDHETVICGWLIVLPESVGMCIGIKDKNGVAVYEGDIIKLTQESQWGKLDQKRPAENFAVEWVEDEVSFQFDHTCSLCNLGGHHIPLLLCIGEGVVIGNTTDNPELLEKSA